MAIKDLNKDQLGKMSKSGGYMKKPRDYSCGKMKKPGQKKGN
jgi:hypothetical protein